LNRLYLAICLLIVVVGIAAGAFFFLGAPKEPRIEGAKVLAIIAEGFDYSEYDGVVRILKKEGAVVTTASFTTETVSGHGGSYEPEVTFDEVNVSLYDIVFIPGGDGPYNIIHHQGRQKVFDLLTQAYNEGKIIAAICHGPWVLAAADLVNGKTITCYNDQPMIDDLTAHGATVDTSKSVIRDGNIITANGPGAIIAFAEEIINVFIEKLSSTMGARIPSKLLSNSHSI